MNFTDGKDRFFESLMRRIPNFSERGAGKMKFKYKFADLDCRYCNKYKKCRYELCPHIIGNLDDLIADKNFQMALETAEMCDTTQRQTLIYLREKSI